VGAARALALAVTHEHRGEMAGVLIADLPRQRAPSLRPARDAAPLRRVVVDEKDIQVGTFRSGAGAFTSTRPARCG
jgi:hypothetical protein